MQKNQKPWPLYLLAIMLLNLLQSFCTELAHDEAYYWMYSQNLDWGYFDHPPAIAVLIGLGYTLLENELGVRLFVVLANLLTIYLMFRITKPDKPSLFFVLLMSCVIAHFGFFAAPDIPLLLTIALFFFFYQRYVKKYDWKNALLLGLTIAAMGYSKYHGIVVLVSVLLSNFDLLKKKTFYLAVLIAVLSYAPHLYWQYLHDFPTFRLLAFYYFGQLLNSPQGMSLSAVYAFPFSVFSASFY
jgi:dolichyl-phosphate-mannose--protein O-mannosyl transferase